MAVLYDKKNIKIKYFRPYEENENSRLVLYPVLVHKVYAPKLEDMKLNIFEKHILSMIHLGYYDINKISDVLCLDPLLVKIVLSQLDVKHLFDIKTNTITESGNKILLGEFSWFSNSDNLRNDIQYVFQDVYSEELFPVLYSINNENENYKITNNVIEFSSKGKTDKYNFDLIEPKGINLKCIKRPTTSLVIAAINEFAKEYISDSTKDIKQSFNAVKFQDSEAELIHIPICLINDSSSNEIDDIKVFDPFELYDFPFWLSKKLKNATKKNNVLDLVFKELTVGRDELRRQQINEHLLNLKQRIENEINRTYSYKLKDYNQLFGAVKAFYFSFVSYEELNDVIYIKSSFSNAQIVLETLFKIIYSEFNLGYKGVLAANNKSVGEFIIFSYQLINTVKTINPSSIVPENLAYDFKGREAFNAFNSPDRVSLRSMYKAAILASKYDIHNPMNVIIKEKYDVLKCFERIAYKRNKYSHKHFDISKDEEKSLYDELLILKNDIKEVVEIFLCNNK